MGRRRIPVSGELISKFLTEGTVAAVPTMDSPSSMKFVGARTAVNGNGPFLDLIMESDEWSEAPEGEGIPVFVPRFEMVFKKDA